MDKGRNAAPSTQRRVTHLQDLLFCLLSRPCRPTTRTEPGITYPKIHRLHTHTHTRRKPAKHEPHTPPTPTRGRTQHTHTHQGHGEGEGPPTTTQHTNTRAQHRHATATRKPPPGKEDGEQLPGPPARSGEGTPTTTTSGPQPGEAGNRTHAPQSGVARDHHPQPPAPDPSQEWWRTATKSLSQELATE